MYIAINGIELYFDIQGSALREVEGKLYELPTIIALHGGLGFDHGYLRDGLGRLSDLAQIIYVDLRGQGRSGRPSLETCTMEQMADDVAELVKSLGIRRPQIFGHSAGGFVAMHLALRHPESIGGLILSGTSPTVAPIQSDVGEPQPSLTDRAPQKALDAAATVFGGDITATSIATFFAEVGPFYAGPGNAELTARLMRLSAPNVEMMRHFMLNLAPGYDLTSRLHRISVPLLVMFGAHDWVCPPRASRAIANAVRNSKLVEFSNSGHFLFSEEPAKFRAVVEDYLASNAAPSWY